VETEPRLQWLAEEMMHVEMPEGGMGMGMCIYNINMIYIYIYITICK